MSSSALGTAVAAWLLRSYGFRNKVIYDILVARGIDLSDLDPAAGSTTGSASANLDKLYFTPAARSRQGGNRGSPSWVPAGVTLGDHMASTLGFADEEALESFTADVVGAIDFDPSATMGGYSRGSAQRNLTRDHWDYTGAAAAVAAKGDLKNLQAHDMNAAFDAAIGSSSYDLASHILSFGAANPATTPVPAPSAPPAPPAPPTPTPTGDDEIDSAPQVPEPPALPPSPPPVSVAPSAPRITTAVADAPMGNSTVLDAVSAGLGAASATWASSAAVAGLPRTEDATRQLNKGTWDSRQAGQEVGAFGDTLSDTRFYPAIDPVYVHIPREYMGSRFGPMDDVTISEMITEEAARVDGILLALANGQRPVFRLISSGTYTEWFDLVMSIDASGNSSSSTSCKDLEDLRIMWSDPESGSSEVMEVRFTLAASGTRSASAAREFRIVSNGDYFTFSSNGNNGFVSMDQILNKVSGIEAERQNWLASAIGSNPVDLMAPGNMLLPFINNPDMANPSLPSQQRPVYFPPGSAITADQSKSVIVFGMPHDGIAGNPLLDINASAIPPRDWDEDPALGNTLIMPATGVEVFTSVDQYIDSPFSGKYLARQVLDWDTDSRVYTLRPEQVASIEVTIRDGSETTAEYAGFTGSEKDRRQVRIFVPGDVPEKLLPTGVEEGSSLRMVQAFPSGTETPERLLLIFDQPTQGERRVELPNDSLKAALRDSRDRPVVGDVLRVGDGYSSLVEIAPSDLPIYMRQVANDRLANRVSEMNHPLDIGVAGLRRLVWQDGGTISILAEDPDDPSKLVWIVISPRTADELY